MTRADRLTAIRAVGRFLRRLHAIHAPDGVPALNMGLLARKALRAYRKASVFSPAFMADLRRRLPALTVPAGRPRRTFLHADLYEDHVIMNRREGRWRMTGVIDFADAGTGDPLYEWAAVKFGFKKSGLIHFLTAVRAYDPTVRLTTRWRDRAAAFMLIHEFAPGTVLDLLKRDAVPTRDLTWPALRDWLLPVTL
jgi:aminoglycoside phosphotransferase (APT) family kinase protein